MVTAAPADFLHFDSCNQGKSKHFTATKVPVRETSALAEPQLPSMEPGRRQRRALNWFKKELRRGEVSPLLSIPVSPIPQENHIQTPTSWKEQPRRNPTVKSPMEQHGQLQHGQVPMEGSSVPSWSPAWSPAWGSPAQWAPRSGWHRQPQSWLRAAWRSSTRN